MDRDAPAGPAKPVRSQIPEGGVEAVQGGGDRVLVLSPGVTLTLGQDALLMSGMESTTEMSPMPLLEADFRVFLLMQANLPPNPAVRVYHVPGSQGPVAHPAAYRITTSFGPRSLVTTGGS
jgi:hypothetical protein